MNNAKLNTQKTISAIEFETMLEQTNREMAFVKREKEMAEKTALMEAQTNKYLQIGIVLLFIILLILLLAYLKIRHQKAALQKSYQKIDKQKNELKALIENKNTLISIIGHDLRGPIGNLYATLDLIPNQQDQLSEETQELFSLTKEGLMGAWDLLENLLIWAKADRPDFSNVPSSFNLYNEIRSICLLYNVFESEKHLKVSVLGEKDVTVFMDKSGFQTIFRNILGNAIKYSPEGESISIKWVNEENFVILEMEDHAGGIPDEILAILLDKNSNKSTVNSKSSQGLGFYLIKTFIAINHCQINVEKTNNGSKFLIQIPTQESKQKLQ